jgi:hypothetical protein
MTLVGAGNVVREYIPPYCIFKYWPDVNWGQDEEADGEIRFAQSETAFSNREIFKDWLKHFNLHSFGYNADFKRKGWTFEEYFGCDNKGCHSDGRENLNPDKLQTHQAIRLQLPDKQRIFRLLLLDSFSGHHHIEIYEYCLRYDILILYFPPHSTHILQPFDVGVFLLLKKAHQRDLRRKIMEGALTFTRHDCVTSIYEILRNGFKAHYLMNGFEDAGIWPINPEYILNRMT